MTQQELEKREAALQEAGYHKSRNTSSTNDYSWFKTIKDPTDPEDWLYMIEWRVWDWRIYADRDSRCAKRPYSMELCVLICLPNKAVVEITHPDGLGIEQAEELAKDFYELINKKRNDYEFN